MILSLAEAYYYCKILTAFAFALQSFEFFLLHKSSLAKKNLARQFIITDQVVLSIMQLVVLLIWVTTSLPLALALLIFAIFNSWQWRGAFNGGSDYMSIVLLTGLALVELSFPYAGLGYIAVQTLLSYFIAGIEKLRHLEWRNGQALGMVLRSSPYLPKAIFQKLVAKPSFSIILCWLLIIFECSSLLLFWAPSYALSFIGVALLFHLLNFYFLGLNRFFWAWLASYPAVLFSLSQFFTLTAK